MSKNQTTYARATLEYDKAHEQCGREDHVMGEKQIVYDRTPDMKIKLSDGRVVTLGELEPMVRAAGKLFACAPWSKNPNPRSTRILASISADGLALFDFKTRISHRWASRQPVRPEDLSGLAELLKRLDT